MPQDFLTLLLDRATAFRLQVESGMSSLSAHELCPITAVAQGWSSNHLVSVYKSYRSKRVPETETLLPTPFADACTRTKPFGFCGMSHCMSIKNLRTGRSVCLSCSPYHFFSLPLSFLSLSSAIITPCFISPLSFKWLIYQAVASWISISWNGERGEGCLFLLSQWLREKRER